MSRLALIYFQWYRADESPQIHIESEEFAIIM
jgi:hypothetical protein